MYDKWTGWLTGSCLTALFLQTGYVMSTEWRYHRAATSKQYNNIKIQKKHFKTFLNTCGFVEIISWTWRWLSSHCFGYMSARQWTSISLCNKKFNVWQKFKLLKNIAKNYQRRDKFYLRDIMNSYFFIQAESHMQPCWGKNFIVAMKHPLLPVLCI